MARPSLVLVMGVSGSGKTTLGRALAEALGFGFCDGDDFHSPASVAKMSRGQALDDADRRPWLAAVAARIEAARAAGASMVLACSALKSAYREWLGVGRPDVFVVHLAGPAEIIRERLRQRTGHFAKDDLLASQLDALQPPDNAITINASRTADEVLDEALERLAPLLPR
jgi:gluconokinase